MKNLKKPYRLFISLRSPFARRVRIALHRFSIPFEAVELNVFEPTDEFLSANPLGLVPVLEIQETHSFMPDSSTILEYLHENHGGQIWPEDLSARQAVRIASTLAEGLMTMTVNLFLESTRKNPDQVWTTDFQDALKRTLATIHEQSLTKFPWVNPGVNTAFGELTQAGWDLMVALEYVKLRVPASFLKGIDDNYPKLKTYFELHQGYSALQETAPPAA